MGREACLQNTSLCSGKKQGEGYTLTNLHTNNIHKVNIVALWILF